MSTPKAKKMFKKKFPECVPDFLTDKEARQQNKKKGTIKGHHGRMYQSVRQCP
jgi:hypothetical protein